MDANRWATLQTLLYDALDLPETERAAFVAEHAGAKPQLAAELNALLDAAVAVPAFLDAKPRWSLGADDGARDLAGQRIGPYHLLRELGRGGQGRVFLAERDDVGTRVALKLVRGGLAAPDLMPRFLRERRVLAGLDHPHIARLLDAGTVETGTPRDATPYFVMEAVEGVPLTAYVQAKAPPLRERLRLFLQVCEAVDFAHRQLVVHRDLKPTNILVTEGEDGARSVKLLDFGIAKLLDESEVDDDLTQTGHRLMTPEYAAPEQVLGQPITVATDVYALGVVLYEVLAGVRPYDTSGGLREVVRAVCDEIHPLPSSRVTDVQRRRSIRGDLDTIVAKALAKAPADRYASVRALADDIERHLQGRPVLARHQTARYRLSRFLRRHALAVGAAAFVVLALGGAVAREMALRRTADAALAETEAALVEATASRDLMREAFGATARFGQSEIRTDTARAITLVDYAAQLLDGRWDDQPILKARLMGQLYHVYTDIGHPERGVEQLEAADRLLAVVNAPPGERVEIARWRGYTLIGQEQCEEALTWFDASRRFAEAMDDPEQVRFADIATASALRCNGRDAEALAIYRRLHETGRVVPPSENLHTGHKEMLINYGYLLYRIGRSAEAIPVLQESSDLFALAFPPGNPATTSVRLHLAQAHRLAGDLPAADRVLRRTLAESRDRVGDAHHQTVRVRADLARVLLQGGRLEEADILSAVVPEPAREASEILPAQMAYAMEARVRVLLALGRPIEAERLAREALALEEGGDPGADWYRRTNMPALAEALRAQGRQAEAEAVLRELAEVERALPPALRVAPF